MSTAGAAGTRSTGKTVVAVILVIIAVLAIIAGVIYLIEPAKSLPGILQPITSPPSRADTNRPLRGAASFIIGVLCLAGAWYTRRARSPQD